MKSKPFMFGRVSSAMLVTLAALGFALATGIAAASDHWGIIIDVTNSPKDDAFFEVGSDVPGTVTFRVFPAGGVPTVAGTASIPANGGLVTSENLFSYAAPDNKTALVQASFDGGGSAAVLRQQSAGEQTLVAVPATATGLGFAFRIAMGDIGQGAYIMVGNTGAATTLRLEFNGSDPGPLEMNIGALEVVRIDVPPWRANHNILLKATDTNAKLVVVLVVDTGKVDQTIIIPVG